MGVYPSCVPAAPQTALLHLPEHRAVRPCGSASAGKEEKEAGDETIV